MQTETITRQNRVLTPILLAIILVVGVLITRPMYTDFLEKSSELATLRSDVSTKEKTRDDLLAIQAQFASGGTTELAKQVARLDVKYDVSDIMETVMLNEYTKSTLENPDPIIELGAISVSKGAKLPSGLSLANVSVQVTGRTMNDVISYITYLTTESRYAFSIDSISLPIDTDPNQLFSNGVFSMPLSLSMYYFE